MRENPNDSVQLSLDRFLMAYRTGESPAHRFLGRGLTTKLNLVRPRFDDTKRVRSVGRRPTKFQVGEIVKVRSYVGNTK